MPNFAYLESVCKASSTLSQSVIDEFLMPYAAQKEHLDREMDLRFGRFRKVARDLQPGWVNRFKAQYIAHRIFKKDGLIKKYLNHAAVKQLTPEERNYLQTQAAVSWRFSFSIITAMPEADFFEMEDVFTGDSFLLYSPSVSKTLAEGNIPLWFNLIGFNGHCWQTFGPVMGFQSFVADDIFFFATELNSTIVTEEDLMEDVEANPVPYMMLITGSNYPTTVHGEDEMIQAIGEYPLRNFDGSRFKKQFSLEYVPGVFRLKLHGWEEAPHFAAAYYSEEENSLLLTAMTDRGYNALAQALISQGLKIAVEPDIRVHLPMIICTRNIFDKDLQLNPYEELFTTESSPEEQADMDRLNRLLSLALPYINAGKEPDVVALAKEAGVEEETAREILEQMTGRFGALQQKGGKGGKGGKGRN